MRWDLATATMPTATRSRRDLLRRFLDVYWLRPENALWMTLRSQVLSCKFEDPSIDISCGDGIFSFLHHGGILGDAFDVFTSVAGLERVCDEHVDMFDCAPGEYQPVIEKHPAQTIDVGIDLKENMLAKARHLALYDRLVEHDNNERLPFEDSSFQTVYCNAAYWVEQIERFLNEMARITRSGGRIILQLKLESIRRYTLESYRRGLGDRFLDIIDRGRRGSWPTITNQSTWEARFADAGLDIQTVTPFVTRTHAHIWDIGLRPVAPLLSRMAGALTPQTRASIKREWVELFCHLLDPLCDPDLNLLDTRDEPAEVQYVLTPR